MDEHSFVKGPSEVKNGFLRYCGKVSIPLAPKGVCRQFGFDNVRGLWVDDTFSNLLGKSVFLKAESFDVGKYQLQERAHDEDILLTIGEGGIYRGEEGKETLKRIIALSIIAQWEGEPGLFLTNVQSNLFYFEQNTTRYVIRVFRTALVPEWNVNIWHLGNDQWEAGDIIFIPSTMKDAS